jgi:NAD(P) transhydrogenase subunit alpha
MKIVIPKEITPGETRVALVPESVAKLTKADLTVGVEKGAGQAAGFPDEAYAKAGAEIVDDPAALYQRADVILKIRAPIEHPGLGKDEVDLYPEGSVLIGLIGSREDGELIERLAKRRISTFSLILLPRISRAQKMDVLSSLSTVAGYKCALLAASSLPKFFPLLMTAAGTIAPAKVYVLGAGVAGLQAIATSRRLGAVVEASDIRPAVREEVQSLGATFVDLQVEAEGEGGYAKEVSASHQEQERKIVAERARASDCVITTAVVPGRKAPVLITKEMVEVMRPGAVIVDLAAEQGGNCELTRAGETVVHNGVSIVGPTNLTASMPTHASQMYSRNIAAFLNLMTKEGALNLDFEDEIVRESCMTHDGKPAPQPQPAADASQDGGSSKA